MLRQTGSLHLDLIDDEAEFVALRSDWDRLQASAARSVPHLTHDWILRCWRRQRDRPRVRLNLLAARHAGRLVMVAPLLAHGEWFGLRSLYWIDSQSPFFCDLLLEESAEGLEACRLVAETLAKDLRIRKVALNSVRADAKCHRLLQYVRHEDRGWSASAKAIDLTGPGGWDGFLTGLSYKRRGNFRRLTRHLARRGAVKLDRVVESAEIEREVAWLFQRKRDQFAGPAPRPGWLTDRDTDVFFLKAAEDGAKSGRCSLHCLRVGDRTIASMLSFREGSTVYWSKMAHDPAWSAVSPGSLLNLLLIQQYFAEGVERIELMLGNHEWKAHLANTETRVEAYRIHGRLFSRQETFVG